MKKLLILGALLVIIACQKKATMGTHVPVDCTATMNAYNEITVTCPDGTTLNLPPEVVTVTETVEVPVIVTVPATCPHDNGNHYGQGNH